MNNDLKKHDRRWFVRGTLAGAGVVLIVAALRLFSPHLVKLGEVYEVPFDVIPAYESAEKAVEIYQLAPQFQWVPRDRLAAQGKLRWLAWGTRVRVMERRVLWEVPLAQVKVLGGPEKGYLGWVAQEDLTMNAER